MNTKIKRMFRFSSFVIAVLVPILLVQYFLNVTGDHLTVARTDIFDTAGIVWGGLLKEYFF